MYKDDNNEDDSEEDEGYGARKKEVAKVKASADTLKSKGSANSKNPA